MRLPRPGSLRARLLAELAGSGFPPSTVALALLCLPDRPNAILRVRQVLVRDWARGLVRRLDPDQWAGRYSPDGPRRGRRPWRWALTPAGLAVVLRTRRRRKPPTRPRPARTST